MTLNLHSLKKLGGGGGGGGGGYYVRLGEKYISEDWMNH